jgi:hypothetical protein
MVAKGLSKFQMEFGDALVGIAVDDFEDETIVDIDIAQVKCRPEDALGIGLVGREADQLYLLGLDDASVDAAEDLYPEAQFQEEVVEICLCRNRVARCVSEAVFGAGGDAKGDSARHLLDGLSIGAEDFPLIVLFDQPPTLELLGFRRGHQCDL